MGGLFTFKTRQFVLIYVFSGQKTLNSPTVNL